MTLSFPSSICLQFPFSSFKFTLTDGVEIALTPTELSESLQYSDTPGIPSFLAELMRLQQAEHKIPYPIDEVAIAVTTGSQDGLTKAFEMLLNPSDSLLVEVCSGSCAAYAFSLCTLTLVLSVFFLIYRELDAQQPPHRLFVTYSHFPLSFPLVTPHPSLLHSQNPTYSGALAFLKPFGVKLIGVNVDDQGLIPSALEKRLRETANSPNR